MSNLHRFIPRANLTPPDKEGGLIVCGDCLEWLKWLPDECVDLCYIDPPFFSKRDYEIIWGNGFEVRSFGDRFSGGVTVYTEWMEERVKLIHSKLKINGSIILHCDWHASHHLRLMLDKVFGEKNFRDEIVWFYSNKYTGNKKDGVVKQHDLIFRYSKSKEFTFNVMKIPTIHGGRTTSTTKRNRVDGRSVKEMKRNSDGSLVHQTVGEKKNLGSVVDLPFLNSQAQERLGYPTQKPLQLIRTLISMASDDGDVVLDCFGGGGTTAVACVELNRRFITGDVSPVAVKIMSDRLNRLTIRAPFEIKNLARTELEYRSMDGHAFASILCEAMGWKSNPRRSADGGLDGWDGYGNPVQIKNQKTPTGRPDLQRFYAVIKGDSKKRGVFVAWEYSRDAREYAATVKRKEGIHIELMECAEAFGSLLLPPEKAAEVAQLYSERKPKEWGNQDSTSVKQKPKRHRAS